MEEIKNEIEEEENQRWITILLIIGNIIIWTIIMLFISIAKVSAASIDYDNTSNYIHKTNGTAEWIQFPRATEYSLSTLNTYDQINLQWTNYQSGVANGVARFEISAGSLMLLNCNQLYDSIRIQENGNTIQVPIQRKSCIKSDNNYVLIEVGFVTSLLGTNSYFEVQFRNNIQLASKVRAYGVMTVNSVDPATNTDIQDQTNALIQNNNENTSIITNAINNANTTIINQMQDNLNLCKLKTYDKNNTTGTLGYLNANGTTGVSTVSKISDYIKIEKNQTYQLVYGDRWANSSYCLYDENKNLLNCVAYNQQTTININNTTGTYIKYTYNFSSDNYFFTGQICQDRTEAMVEELWVLQKLMHTEPWTHVTPDISDFEDMEDAEDELHTYTNVDLENIDFDIDSDTNSWVWNTLTRFLNSNIQVMGFVITLLSIGIIKLVLGR